MTAAFGAAAEAIAGAAGRLAAGMFGDAVSGWGEGEMVGALDDISLKDALEAAHKGQRLDLGGGNWLELDAEGIKAMMWQPEVIDALVAAGQRVVDAANSLAQIEGAEYGMIVQDQDRSYPCPRVLVVAMNAKAKIDDQHHSTLIQAQMVVGGEGPVEASPIPITW